MMMSTILTIGLRRIPHRYMLQKAFYLPHQMIHKLVLVYSYIYQCHFIITNNMILTSEYFINVDVL